MSELVISLLGTFAVSRGGVTVIDESWPRKKPAALLKLLALHPRRRLPRERAIDLLWPDADEESGANNLHKALHYIRSELGDCAGALRIEQGAIVLDPSVVTDVRRFEELAAEAKRLPDDISAYQAAVDAYAGHLLPDDAYEWLEPERGRLRELWRSLRLHLCCAVADRGLFVDAASAIEPLVGDDPADERAQAAYMRVLARSGERNNALRQYDILRDALYDELAVTPSPETVALREEIAANRIAPEPSARSALHVPEVLHTRTTDGVRIAYATFGAGARVPLVMMPFVPWGDLLLDCEYDEMRRFVESLASNRLVVRFDARSLGQSQREVDDVSNDSQVRDLEAVVDALGLESFDLFAAANSAPQTFTYSYRHPGRVRRIVCSQAWYNGPVYMAQFDRLGFKDMARSDYETFCQTTGHIAIGDGATEAFYRRHVAYLQATPRDIYEKIRLVLAKSDVTELLSAIEQPVLAIISRHTPANVDSGQVRALPRLVKRGVLRELDASFAPWGIGYEDVVRLTHQFLDATEPVNGEPPAAG